MANKSYLARVELHHDEDYDTLHELLYQIGYYRTIFLKSGHWHDLPHATYICHIDSTVKVQTEILENTIRLGLSLKPANEAVRSEKSFSLTVSESELDENGLYKARYALRLSNQSSVLPPGEMLV